MIFVLGTFEFFYWMTYSYVLLQYAIRVMKIFDCMCSCMHMLVCLIISPYAGIPSPLEETNP